MVIATAAGLLTTALVTQAGASDPLTFVGINGLPRPDSPEAVAVDSDGNVDVADRNTIGLTTNDRLVKYSPDGVFLDMVAGPERRRASRVPIGVGCSPDESRRIPP